MTTQLSLYNGALRKLKERKLASLVEETKARRQLDDVWDSGGVIKACLEQGYWNFAIRTSKITKEVGFTPSFGYANQFIIPADFVRLVALSTDPYQRVPLNRYTEEAGNWYADETEIYVSYISNDDDYGANLSRWPETFVTFVEFYLANEVAGVLTGEEAMVEKALRAALVDARSKDAMNEPTKFMPQGTFTRARMGGRARSDRGNRGSLIG